MAFEESSCSGEDQVDGLARRDHVAHPELGSEVVTLEVLHDDERKPVRRRVDIEDANDVRRSQERRGSRLALEARDPVVRRERIGHEELDGRHGCEMHVEARRAAGREVDLADVGKIAVGEHVQRPSARRDSQLLGQRTLAQAAVTEANACSHRVARDRDRGDAVAEVAQLIGEPRHPRSQLRRRRFLERLELFERLRIFAQPLQRAALVVEERGILGQAIGLDVRRERIGRAPGGDRVIPALLDLGGTGRGLRRCGFWARGFWARGLSARERRMGAHER